MGQLLDAAVLWAVNTTPPEPPTVTITNPVFAQTFSSNANIVLAVQTTEGNGGAVASVRYFANGTTIGISTNWAVV